MLRSELRAVVDCGARAFRLLADAPGFIDMLVPDVHDPDGSRDDRALVAEALIRAAIDSLEGGPASEALMILLGMAPGTHGMAATSRKAKAAEAMGWAPETFRRDSYMGRLLGDLAMEIYRLCTAKPPAP